MQSYTLNGKTYYYNNGTWLDRSYIRVPLAEAEKLDRAFAVNESLVAKSPKELIELADGASIHDNYTSSEKALKAALETCKANRDIYQIKSILPRLTSIMRKQHHPQSAIQLFTEYNNRFGKTIWSTPLLTSIAAAYCDINNCALAKQFADRAFAFSGGTGSKELSNVYARIKNSSGNS